MPRVQDSWGRYLRSRLEEVQTQQSAVYEGMFRSRPKKPKKEPKLVDHGCNPVCKKCMPNVRKLLMF